jgi:hypothetical protein
MEETAEPIAAADLTSLGAVAAAVIESGAGRLPP